SLVLFMQPTLGGECGPSSGPQNHLWAHRGALFPGYMTKDPWPNHAGKFLQVQDYILQSGLGGSDSCTGTDIMPIGTVAHETGHGFGLPDLYDTSDSTAGVGRWSLMGAGNFSSPSSPARMDAWSLSQLGWVTLAPLATSGAYSFGAAPTSDTAFVVRPTGANPNIPCTPPAAGCGDRGDVGDPFPGVTQNPTLALFTTPNTALNSGACAGVGIDSIGQVVPNGAMRFVLRLGGDSLAVVTTPRLAAAHWGFFYS